MVVRMPFGGLRHAGPFHSQNTEPWFYRTAGLKIVVPSTPHDARALMASAVADPDPVLYYEHIALYRDPRIKQVLTDDPPAPIPLGKAALRRAGDDLAIVSYGAFVHVGLRVAEKLAADGIERERARFAQSRPAGSRRGARAGPSLSSRPDHSRGLAHRRHRREPRRDRVRKPRSSSSTRPSAIVGALDTPVPYSPPLEEFYLPSEAQIEQAARLLVAY